MSFKTLFHRETNTRWAGGMSPVGSPCLLGGSLALV